MVRHAFARLWWAAELTVDGDDYRLTEKLLAMRGFQDAYEGFFGREFSHYRPALEAAIEVLESRKEKVVRETCRFEPHPVDRGPRVLFEGGARGHHGEGRRLRREPDRVKPLGHDPGAGAISRRIVPGDGELEQRSLRQPPGLLRPRHRDHAPRSGVPPWRRRGQRPGHPPLASMNDIPETFDDAAAEAWITLHADERLARFCVEFARRYNDDRGSLSELYTESAVHQSELHGVIARGAPKIRDYFVQFGPPQFALARADVATCAVTGRPHVLAEIRDGVFGRMRTRVRGLFSFDLDPDGRANRSLALSQGEEVARAEAARLHPSRDPAQVRRLLEEPFLQIRPSSEFEVEITVRPEDWNLGRAIRAALVREHLGRYDIILGEHSGRGPGGDPLTPCGSLRSACGTSAGRSSVSSGFAIPRRPCPQSTTSSRPRPASTPSLSWRQRPTPSRPSCPSRAPSAAASSPTPSPPRASSPSPLSGSSTSSPRR